MERCRNYPIYYIYIIFVSIIFFSFALNCSAVNTITVGEVVRDGQTVISEQERFALGFFSPNGSNSRYVGIWYNGIPDQPVIWVANRETPITGSGGVLRISADGNLVVLNGTGILVWSSNVTTGISLNTSTRAVLGDDGDLTLTISDNNDDPLWRSFMNPTDTFLPGMRVAADSDIGEIRPFTSWRNANDPAHGRFSLGVDPRGSPQIIIWEGENRRWRSGHWNGVQFIGVPNIRTTYFSGFNLNIRDGKQFFTYNLPNPDDLIRFFVRYDGFEEQLRFNRDENRWGLVQSQPSNVCETYNTCGPFAICTTTNNSPVCSCIHGFVPRDSEQWNSGNRSGGCIQRTELNCGQENVEEDGFFRIQNAKLPDNLDWVGSEELADCRERCLRNCSCRAYACVPGISCMIWNGDLVDVPIFAEGGNDLYVRLAYSELSVVESGDSRRRRTRRLVIITVAVIAAFLLCVSLCLLFCCRRRFKAFSSLWRKNNENPKLVPSSSGVSSVDFSGPDDLSKQGNHANGSGSGSDLELINFGRVAAATDNFSDENLLGKGGFGSVYKGVLPGGQEIAVKRLSRKSGQGIEEFKNEITLIAKLQHRNLVRLLGCCIEGEEKILLYEYMPNKSLDSYIFGEQTRQAELNWKKRLAIIEGIARGLLYLHRDSRLRIIHRDLKASNILLDDEMNPKISDFGMARIFGGNQNEANTNRIVGTYGYMAPEYAMEGLFSVKSDVYSFGVLLLEIISGRRNTSYRSPEFSNIIGYAWDLWNRGKAMDLVDPAIMESCSEKEVLKCIHVGMLCVQDSASYRPTMSAVILMLESESTNLPLAKQPTFTSMHISGPDHWNESREVVSSNNVTISVIYGR